MTNEVDKYRLTDYVGNRLDISYILLKAHFKLPMQLQENYPLIEESCNNLYKQFMTDISNYLRIT